MSSKRGSLVLTAMSEADMPTAVYLTRRLSGWLRVHWSVLAKRASAEPAYSPSNLPAKIPPEQIAAITDEERALLGEQIPGRV